MRPVGEWALTSHPFFLHSNVLFLFITCFNGRLHSFASIPVFANAKQSVGFRIPFHFNFVILSFYDIIFSLSVLVDWTFNPIRCFFRFSDTDAICTCLDIFIFYIYTLLLFSFFFFFFFRN